MARRVMLAEVSGGRVRGRPSLNWMDGVKLGNKGMTVEAARQYATPHHLILITTRAWESGPKEHRAKQKWLRETHLVTYVQGLSTLSDLSRSLHRHPLLP